MFLLAGACLLVFNHRNILKNDTKLELELENENIRKEIEFLQNERKALKVKKGGNDQISVNQPTHYRKKVNNKKKEKKKKKKGKKKEKHKKKAGKESRYVTSGLDRSVTEIFEDKKFPSHSSVPELFHQPNLVAYPSLYDDRMVQQLYYQKEKVKDAANISILVVVDGGWQWDEKEFAGIEENSVCTDLIKYVHQGVLLAVLLIKTVM